MTFIKGKTIPGKIFIPDFKPDAVKKHPCPDCFACQMCSDDRCELCRTQQFKAETDRNMQNCKCHNDNESWKNNDATL
ncbi:hypothetical protein QUF90_06175 [Desulfococcaceae bacterium HSG9]|nr:hypothetical protein [Desulfococcaceae bacterium HSG9]